MFLARAILGRIGRNRRGRAIERVTFTALVSFSGDVNAVLRGFGNTPRPSEGARRDQFSPHVGAVLGSPTRPAAWLAGSLAVRSPTPSDARRSQACGRSDDCHHGAR